MHIRIETNTYGPTTIIKEAKTGLYRNNHYNRIGELKNDNDNNQSEPRWDI